MRINQPWKKLPKGWPKVVPKFDHNCKRRLYGFIQGAFYRLMDDEKFNPNFRVKRPGHFEVPQGEIDEIVKVIVGFIPVEEMLCPGGAKYWSTFA